MDQLERVQRQAIRFVCGPRGVESVTEARESLGVATLKERKQTRLKLIVQILNDDGHSTLQNELASMNKTRKTRLSEQAGGVAKSARYGFKAL